MHRQYPFALMAAGRDYRFARAMFELGHHRRAVAVGLNAARLLNFPTAAERSAVRKQGGG